MLFFPTLYSGKKTQQKVQSQWKPVPKAIGPLYDPITSRPLQDIHDFVLDIQGFRTLSREIRQQLFEGSSVQLTVNQELVVNVPLRLLLTAS
jgi:hypothetical protein